MFIYELIKELFDIKRIRFFEFEIPKYFIRMFQHIFVDKFKNLNVLPKTTRKSKFCMHVHDVVNANGQIDGLK